MSWRRLLAVGYALLVEGLDAAGRGDMDLALQGRESKHAAERDLQVLRQHGEVA